jgi:hypothetical protein
VTEVKSTDEAMLPEKITFAIEPAKSGEFKTVI